MPDVFLCCERFEAATSPNSRMIVLSGDQPLVYITDWRNMFSVPIQFCPFCGTEIKPSQESDDER